MTDTPSDSTGGGTENALRSSWAERALVRTGDLAFGSNMMGLLIGTTALVPAMLLQGSTPVPLHTAFSDALTGAGAVGLGLGLAGGPVQLRTSRMLENMGKLPVSKHLAKSSGKFAKAGAAFALVATLAGAGASAAYGPEVRASQQDAATHVDAAPAAASATYTPVSHP